MLEDEIIYCIDVLEQVNAVTGALGKVRDSALRSHIRDHVTTVVHRGDTDVGVDELTEAPPYRA